ncbi:MAG: hypothetical protein U5N26_06145 [Candidatus Marinimicrobia bacterium]|nr:hypothetical protein [Candidatus Neomarinimicrobiota bacterium]
MSFQMPRGKRKYFRGNSSRDIFASIEEGLRKDEHVNIKGLGIFKLQEVPEERP